MQRLSNQWQWHSKYAIKDVNPGFMNVQYETMSWQISINYQLMIILNTYVNISLKYIWLLYSA